MDGVDTARVGMHTLRRNLAIIPQVCWGSMMLTGLLSMQTGSPLRCHYHLLSPLLSVGILERSPGFASCVMLSGSRRVFWHRAGESGSVQCANPHSIPHRVPVEPESRRPSCFRACSLLPTALRVRCAAAFQPRSSPVSVLDWQEHSDAELWQALEATHLKAYVAAQPEQVRDWSLLFGVLPACCSVSGRFFSAPLAEICSFACLWRCLRRC